MTSAVLDHGICTEGAPLAGRQATGASGGPTLDELISGVWEGLSARVFVACPVCTRPLRAASPAAVRCGGCGSTLS